MKARVKATGEIMEVAYHGLGVYMNQWDEEYQFDEIVILDNSDPYYWVKLKHQYVGMAMQGLMTILPHIGGIKGRSQVDEIVDMSFTAANALVKKLMEEQE